ncbi:hypothetical protein ACIA8G_25295 [Lentzea sp. NPDC051213]|uniref:hypothetical protein n=1 Tax=Lentzea sp. NPDC051213 TaxID=3364126 RepID=UPI00378BCD44
MTADLSALDAVLRNASSVRIAEIEWYGDMIVALSRPDERDRLRAAMAVGSLPGMVCACRGQVRFEFLDAQGERLTVVVLHHGITLDWRGWEGHATLADGAALLRWLDEHGMSAPLRGADERPERLDWIAAIPAALEPMTKQLLGHFRRTSESAVVVEARERMYGADFDPASRVLQLLAWCASGTGRQSDHPPYEDIPGLVLREVPIAEIAAALEDPRAGGGHHAGAARHLLGVKTRDKQRLDVARLPSPVRIRLGEAARAAGVEIPQWAERFLSA